MPPLLLALLGIAALSAGLSGRHAAWGLVAPATLTALRYIARCPLARRRRRASEFGARFDMQTNAALILVLCALVWQAGQTGSWVLAAGLLPYAFVAAARPWPCLTASVAPRRRRQTNAFPRSRA